MVDLQELGLCSRNIGGCIVDEDATSLVVAVRIPKKMVRNNHWLLAALSEHSGPAADPAAAPALVPERMPAGPAGLPTVQRILIGGGLLAAGMAACVANWLML